jgi:hypothetical protein
LDSVEFCFVIVTVHRKYNSLNVHQDSAHLNRATLDTERVYVILKAVVRLSHPAPLDLVLRKRLCISIVAAKQRPSLKDKIRKRLSGRSGGRPLHSVSVIYQLVSNVPSSSAELEDRKSLAVMAALGGGSGQEDFTVAAFPGDRTTAAATSDASAVRDETFIERYSRGISAVDTILFLDRLRQSVAVKEALKAAGKQGLLSSTMRKTVSVPNFSSVLMTRSRSMDNLAAVSRLSAAAPRLRTSMSVNDFDQPMEAAATLGSTGRPGGSRRPRRGLATVPEADQLGGEGGTAASNAVENLTRPTFLNLGTALTTREASWPIYSFHLPIDSVQKSYYHLSVEDPHVFAPLGSFSHKCVEWTELMPVKCKIKF